MYIDQHLRFYDVTLAYFQKLIELKGFTVRKETTNLSLEIILTKVDFEIRIQFDIRDQFFNVLLKAPTWKHPFPLWAICIALFSEDEKTIVAGNVNEAKSRLEIVANNSKNLVQRILEHSQSYSKEDFLKIKEVINDNVRKRA